MVFKQISINSAMTSYLRYPDFLNTHTHTHTHLDKGMFNVLDRLQCAVFMRLFVSLVGFGIDLLVGMLVRFSIEVLFA